MFGLDAGLLLNAVKQYSEMMIKNLNPTVMSLLMSFMMMDLVLSFLFDDSEGMDIFMKLMKKVLYYGFFIWLIQGYSVIIFKTLMGGAIQLANVASGKGSSTTLDVDMIAQFGADAGDVAAVFGASVGAAILDWFGVESVATVVMFGAMGYIMFFIMLYVQILTIFAKFYLISGYAFLLIPFGVFSKTKDIALKAINGLFSQAIEIFVLVVILNLASEFMIGSFAPTMALKLDGIAAIKKNLFSKFAVLIFLFLLINKAGSIASAMLSGAIASLGIGAETGGRGFSSATSAPGKAIGGSMEKASTRQGVGGPLREGSRAKSAYQNAANFMKNFNKK